MHNFYIFQTPKLEIPSLEIRKMLLNPNRTTLIHRDAARAKVKEDRPRKKNDETPREIARKRYTSLSLSLSLLSSRYRFAYTRAKAAAAATRVPIRVGVGGQRWQISPRALRVFLFSPIR